MFFKILGGNRATQQLEADLAMEWRLKEEANRDTPFPTLQPQDSFAHSHGRRTPPSKAETCQF